MSKDVKWDLVPLGVVADFHTGWTPPSGDERYYGGDHKWANISDVGARDLYDTERTISDLALEKQPGARLARPGELLFPFKLSIGAVSFVREEMYTNEAIAVFPPNGKIELRFAYYAFPYFLLKNAGVNIYGAPLLNSTLIKQSRVPLPPLETQQRIADYLDRETAEIDAAVADLDRYVELLEQRRLLVVDEVLHSNGVTVSEWSEMPLKLIIRERFVGDWGGDPGTADVDSVCVRVADFDRSNNTVNGHVPTIRSYSREKYEAKRLRNHDILVERSGGGAKTPVGSAILYKGGDEALCANFIEVVRLDNNQLPEYWVHVLRREYMGRNTMRFVKQTTGIQNLDPQGFYDQKFPVPSLDIQRALVTELNGMTAEIDTLITESTKLRELLLKRRSVLITDVVTGRKQV